MLNTLKIWLVSLYSIKLYYFLLFMLRCGVGLMTVRKIGTRNSNMSNIVASTISPTV